MMLIFPFCYFSMVKFENGLWFVWIKGVKIWKSLGSNEKDCRYYAVGSTGYDGMWIFGNVFYMMCEIYVSNFNEVGWIWFFQ